MLRVLRVGDEPVENTGALVRRTVRQERPDLTARRRVSEEIETRPPQELRVAAQSRVDNRRSRQQRGIDPLMQRERTASPIARSTQATPLPMPGKSRPQVVKMQISVGLRGDGIS